MVALLASSGLARCEAVLHGYETSLLMGGGVVLTCDSAHSWQLYTAALLEQQAVGTP